jgi:hypothetical protein
MAAIREDLAMLATARLEDGRLLVARAVVEDSTVQIALWHQSDGGMSPDRPVLEIAADPRELAALRELCAQLAGASWATIGDGAEIARSAPLADGACIAARRSGDGVALARGADPDNRIVVPRAALDRLAADLLPAAEGKLEALGLAPPPSGAAG